ncbi:MAG: hypothetical protein Q7R96_06640 [Nanoarchaeota archaeon]|nr:hypothetical protein [Nanoarchaeota archaeon]
MSTFYTWEQLQQHPPSKEQVIEARNSAIALIMPYQGHVVLFGSTAWSMHGLYPDQHTRRSDIDIAENYFPSATIRHDLQCSMRELSQLTSVPINITGIEDNKHYKALINPSTRDHFKLLEKNFPHEPYNIFRKYMETKKRDRQLDVQEYLAQTLGRTSRLSHLESQGQLRFGNIWQGIILEEMCALENAPDHLLRKILGIEKMLPCPDSKTNVREVFKNFSYTWNLRNIAKKAFEEVWQASQQYETLIDKAISNKINEDHYSREFFELGAIIRRAVKESFYTIRSHLYGAQEIIRIPAGTTIAVVEKKSEEPPILEKARIMILQKPFGNRKNGLDNYFESCDWIQDPEQPEGWFTVQGPSYDYTRKRSIVYVKNPNPSKISQQS